jgi:ABC-2 type transport system permease protein
MGLPRTLYRFWSSSIAAEMEYRINFVVSTITALGNLAGSIFTLSLLWNNGHRFAGWGWYDALLIIGLFSLLESISTTFLSPNLSRIVQHVQRGTLDFVLLKPLDSQLWLSLRQMSPWGVPNFLFALGLIIYAGWHLHVAASMVLIGLVPVVLGALILYSLWFAVSTSTIWFTKMWNATEVLRSFLEAGRYPVSAYPLAYQFVFKFILPVAFLTSVPANVIRGQYTLGRAAEWIGAQAVIVIVLLIFTRWFWRFALRYYTSASS